MTCYQTLKSTRTLSPPVTTWVRLARAVRARSSSDRLGLHAYGHGAYWEADGGVMPARLSTRTAVDGSDGVGAKIPSGPHIGLGVKDLFLSDELLDQSKSSRRGGLRALI